jgi:hypothetical protein
MAIASQRGLRRLEGDVLEDNHAMLALMRELGFEVHEHASEPGVHVVARDLVEARSLQVIGSRENTGAPAYSA